MLVHAMSDEPGGLADEIKFARFFEGNINMTIALF